MGFDNIELSQVFRPALSTVSKPHYEMAQYLARKVMEVIEGKKTEMAHMVVEPSLKLRETTRKRDYDSEYD